MMTTGDGSGLRKIRRGRTAKRCKYYRQIYIEINGVIDRLNCFSWGEEGREWIGLGELRRRLGNVWLRIWIKQHG